MGQKASARLKYFANSKEVRRISMSSQEKKQVTRRDYLKTTAGAIAGLVVGGAVGYLATPTQVTTQTVTETQTVTVTGTAPPPTTPTAQPFKHGKSVMYLTPDIAETWWVACKTYLQRAVEADGWKFKFDTSDWSDSKCSDQLITYAQQYDCIFVFPTSLEGINPAIESAEKDYHCPVVAIKNFITGHARFTISFDDFGAGQTLVNMAIADLQRRFGTTKGKTVVGFQGPYAASGWHMRALGVIDAMKKHPEMKYVEVQAGTGDPAGWADAADTYFATQTADAVVSGSGGPYWYGTMNALSRYGKLYYVGDPKHIYSISIDGKPSDLQWIRRGYVDDSLSQSPDALMPLGWQLMRDYIVKDASYQYPPYKIPDLPTPMTVTNPPNSYWPPDNNKMLIDKGLIYPETDMPQGVSPVYTVNKDNVNTKDIWGNTYTFWRGKEEIQMTTWPAKGTPPAWSQKLLDDYEAMFKQYYQW